MKKGNLAKWIFCIIFVVAAGIFYLCTDKMPGQKNGAEMVLQNTKDGFDMERTKDLGEIGKLGKIVNLSQSPPEDSGRAKNLCPGCGGGRNISGGGDCPRRGWGEHIC